MVGELELANLVANRSREAAAHVPEELRLQQGVGDRAAVDGDEGSRGPGRSRVQEPREKVLPHAALPGDQDLGRSRGNAQRSVAQLLHRRAVRIEHGIPHVPSCKLHDYFPPFQSSNMVIRRPRAARATARPTVRSKTRPSTAGRLVANRCPSTRHVRRRRSPWLAHHHPVGRQAAVPLRVEVHAVFAQQRRQPVDRGRPRQDRRQIEVAIGNVKRHDPARAEGASVLGESVAGQQMDGNRIGREHVEGEHVIRLSRVPRSEIRASPSRPNMPGRTPSGS